MTIDGSGAMTINGSPDYYRMREHQELDAAKRAAHDAIRQIHLTLADKYRGLAKDAEMRSQ